MRRSQEFRSSFYHTYKLWITWCNSLGILILFCKFKLTNYTSDFFTSDFRSSTIVEGKDMFPLDSLNLSYLVRSCYNWKGTRPRDENYKNTFSKECSSLYLESLIKKNTSEIFLYSSKLLSLVSSLNVSVSLCQLISVLQENRV